MVNIWDLFGYVNASTYRKKVLQSLAKNTMTPREIERTINIKISHISRALTELKEKKLAECINPSIRKYKMYQLTKQGKDLVKRIK